MGWKLRAFNYCVEMSIRGREQPFDRVFCQTEEQVFEVLVQLITGMYGFNGTAVLRIRKVTQRKYILRTKQSMNVTNVTRSEIEVTMQTEYQYCVELLSKNNIRFMQVNCKNEDEAVVALIFLLMRPAALGYRAKISKRLFKDSSPFKFNRINRTGT